MLISEAFDMYKHDFIQIQRQSTRTEEMHDFVRKNFIQFIGNKDIEELSINDVRQWFDKISRTRCNNTVRGYIIKLRRVLEYCSKRGISTINPDIIPVPKRDESIVTYLTEKEVTSMIQNAPNIRSKFIISLLYSSGIRLEELLQLDRNAIYQQKFTVCGKGGKIRLCFIDNRTESLMKEYLSSRNDCCNALVVSIQNKERMTRTNVELLVKNAARRAGISKHVTPHTLRHSYATNFLRNNGNMGYLSKMMGHKSLDTTMIYAHVIDNDLEAQYRKYHSV